MGSLVAAFGFLLLLTPMIVAMLDGVKSPTDISFWIYDKSDMQRGLMDVSMKIGTLFVLIGLVILMMPA